jgi:hypothetical protein
MAFAAPGWPLPPQDIALGWRIGGEGFEFPVSSDTVRRFSAEKTERFLQP